LFEGGSAGCTYVFSSKFAADFRNNLFDIDYQKWDFFSHDLLIYFYARINCLKVVIDSRSEILYRIHGQNVHGQLNKSSFIAILRRLQLVNNGWYFKQLDGFSQLIENSLEEKTKFIRKDFSMNNIKQDKKKFRKWIKMSSNLFFKSKLIFL
jgi:rhamnosyltransferase